MKYEKLIIFVSKCFDFSARNFAVGGIQTYIKDLAQLALSLGFKTFVYQTDNSIPSQNVLYNGIEIHNISSGKSPKKIYRKLVKQNPDTLFILATDQLNIKHKGENAIQIQHGIAFDTTNIDNHGKIWLLMKQLRKLLSCVKSVIRINQAPITVCVDYNYFNWFRAVSFLPRNKKFVIIPNYASAFITEDELSEKINSFKGIKSIIFARRFFDYRGTMIFANAVEKLLKTYPETSVTFAGSGPLEEELHRRFDKEPRVKITRFTSENSIKIHKEYDVAVIPTLYSEGTSLSLCEAMAAGCLPVATHVGGITNIILDSFNGFLSYPDEENLYKTLTHVMSVSPDEFKDIVRNAYNSAKTTFSHNHWAKRWSELLLSTTK